MDLRKRMLLQHHQQDIVKDLDVSDILDYLFSKNAITSEDFQYVFDLKRREDRARYLLDTLVQNGNNVAYEVFVDSLAKPYYWLWEKLVDDKSPTMNDSFEDSLSRGDVPRLPDHYVRRMAVEKEVAAKLKQLSRHQFLVLHGMSGSGKTSAVISVLRSHSDLITNNFNGVVFWLNFGNCKTEDDIIAQQVKLHRKASSMYGQNSYMNSSISMSSIGSNADSSLSSYDWTSQELKDKLKSQFSEQTLKDALLVLDEVNEKKCLDAFDIGCKILVTTRDTDVVANFHPQIVKIENSLEERETLELFASCLDINVSDLPGQAKKLHDICKGSPFHIALIGAQFAENKERMIHDTSLWKFYLKKLERKEYFFLPRHSDNPMKAVEVCINSLKPSILTLFKMLTILPDNAKVSAKVLSKLWNKEVTEVESIMKQLRSKSLIIELYDYDQRNYIYEIHDLIMNYLRTTSNDEEVKRLHSDFLKSYNYNNNNTPLEITDDGYIAFYIGYHILNTKDLNSNWDLFNKLYLNLKFLGNKVRLTGPADVILDLQKYEPHIAVAELDKDLLYSIKAYLSTHGTDLYRYPCTDIVQSILQHETKGILYCKALEIAQKHCGMNELYFEFLHEQNVEEVKHSTIDVKDKVMSVCFLGNYVLVGTVSGVIKFFHISTNKLKKELPITNSQNGVKWIELCPVYPPILAALTTDGTIKMLYIDDLEQDDTDNFIEEEPEEYNNDYPSVVQISPKMGPFLSCHWAYNTDTLFTHTSKIIILYNPKGEVLKVVDNFDRDHEILSCVPCNNDRQVVIATNKSPNNIEVIDLATKSKIMVFEESETVLDMLTVPGTNRIITLKENSIIEHHYRIKPGSYQNNCVCSSKTVIKKDAVKEGLRFIAFAVNKTGSLLFVSTDDSRVICVDLKTNSHVFDLENRRGDVISIATSEMPLWDDFVPGSDVLLTGTGSIENSAKVWYLESSYVLSQTTQKNGKVRLTTEFDVSFLNTQSPHTPSTSNSGPQSSSSPPKRHRSFNISQEVNKPVAKKTMSLDRHNLKPLNLKGLICNGNDGVAQPLLAVVDEKNNIQIMRGRKVLTEILTNPNEQITIVKISPCNQYILYGLRSGIIKIYTLRTKDSRTIMDVYSPVQYMKYVNPSLLIVAGKNRCLMAYKLNGDGEWKPDMLERGNTNLGSQEILNDIQGIKKKNSPSDKLSSSDSESSLNSRDRMFPNGDRLCHKGELVHSYWIPDTGLITIDSNASVKLWSQHLKLISVLNGRQNDVRITCAAFSKNILVLCDDYNREFQTFELKNSEQMELKTIQQYKLNNRIISCDLTADGNVLAMGLDSGDVVIWNVPGKRQLRLLKHHKTKVHYCSFSPVPDRLYRSTTLHSPSPYLAHRPVESCDDEQPPLVLVTMASEIVWWNITHVMRIRQGIRTGWNVVTPLASPLEIRNDLPTAMDNLNLTPPNNFFFGEGIYNPHNCWRAMWKRKKCKEGSKRKEILACIKLSGVTAKKVCHDDKFSCFVTVDNPGHIHIMNVM